MQRRRRTSDARSGRETSRLAGPRPRVAVAFSGGVDSTVLAHALAQQRSKFGALRLLHVDHGLQAASARVEPPLRASWRAGWRVPLRRPRGRRFGAARGDSPEAAAREARYALLAQAMEPGEVLVTAQHRDDQVETLLLQLFRGAGVAGLAAMPPIARFGPGRIARPLLGDSRARHRALRARARACAGSRTRPTWNCTSPAISCAHEVLPHHSRSNGRARTARSRAVPRTWPRPRSCSPRWGRRDLRAARRRRRRERRRAARAAGGAAAQCAARLHRAFRVETPSDREAVGDRRQPARGARRMRSPRLQWPGAVVRRRGGRLNLK